MRKADERLAHRNLNAGRPRTFVLKRSSRDMPGLRGTPAGMTTTSAPVSASTSPSFLKPVTLAFVGMWLRSAATPGVKLATSYSDRWSMLCGGGR